MDSLDGQELHGEDSTQNQSSTNSSLVSLPDNTKPNDKRRNDPDTDEESSISEHISSSQGSSAERDRSFQEIEITNIPMTSNMEPNESLLLNIIDDNMFPSYSAEEGLKKLEQNLPEECTKNVQSILEEILSYEVFKSESDDRTVVDSNDVSLNIFANVDLDDRSLKNYKTTKIEPFDTGNNKTNNSEDTNEPLWKMQQQVTNKDSKSFGPISEVDSIKEFLSNPSTSSTEYKLYQEEFQNKVIEYHNAMAHKDGLIHKLTESLQESIANREELKSHADSLKEEIVNLQKQLHETSVVLKQHSCFSESVNVSDTPQDKSSHQDVTQYEQENLPECIMGNESDYTEFKRNLNGAQSKLFDKLILFINNYLQQQISDGRYQCENQIETLKLQYEKKIDEYISNINALNETIVEIKKCSPDIVREELEAKHAKEVEELRTYFEKKCADLGKNYSEEIFSQQSRKASISSLDSDAGLLSDMLAPVLPGPAGDMATFNTSSIDPNKRDLLSLTQDEFSQLRHDLHELLKSLENLGDKLTDEDLKNVGCEISKYDFRILAKYDLASIKKDIQNKYYAELEILRENYETGLDTAKVKYKDNIKALEAKYLEEIELLREQINKSFNPPPILSSTIQEVGSLGEFEITEVVQSYERRLQEQVTLAKIDIITALETQIQKLVANDGDDEEWPSELLQLRDRFTEKYEKEITQMIVEHQNEIDALKEEHQRNVTAALERGRKRSLKEPDSWNKEVVELIKERDIFKKQVSSLRHLLGELLKYFTQCEDELNNTLVEELFKSVAEENPRSEIPSNLDNSSDSTTPSSLTNIKRVHLAPNFSDLLKIIDVTAVEEDENKDVSADLKTELECCLEKLRAEANAVLTLTMNIKKASEPIKGERDPEARLEQKLNSITRQLISETQLKNELNSKLEECHSIIQSLESERSHLEATLEDLLIKQKSLEEELAKAHQKISELIESGRREIISEGFGEDGAAVVELSGSLSASLMEFQERARSIMNESTLFPDQSLGQMIEEFCRMGERISESAKTERNELIQQINAADKKYKTTISFLEDQTVEREQEREEAQKEISALQEMLRLRDKDRVSCERFTSEVEEFSTTPIHKNAKVKDLESQLRELTAVLEEHKLKLKESDTEKNDAIEKIYVLRDIIRDLENQIEVRINTEADLKAAIQELECIVKHQTEYSVELQKRIDESKNISDVNILQKHIADLEKELQGVRLSAELVGGEDIVNQLSREISQVETTLDKKTKDLEALHCVTSANSCSSPSEDMSVRDVVNLQHPTSSLKECQVPLQQLDRLKEKLLRHSRAEDAAVKKIKDLEMQVFSMKNEIDESLNEREILKRQISEQLVLISSLQIRLDDQRIRAENMEKQTNTSLELRIYDLQSEIETLQERIRGRDKTINQLNAVLAETRQRLKTQEDQMSAVKPEDELISNMQREIEHLRCENHKLASKMNNEAQILPNLVENIISDKNNDIEKLRAKLLEAEKQLEVYNTLNLDKSHVNVINRLRSSGTSLDSILSLLDSTGPEQVLRSEARQDSLSLSAILPIRKHDVSTDFENESAISPIHKLDNKPLQSTEVSKGINKHVRFDDTVIESLKTELSDLKQQLLLKDDLIKEYTERLQVLDEVQQNMEKLQEHLEQTENTLKNVTATFEKEQEEAKLVEKNLKVELAEKKLHISDKDKQLEVYKQDSQRKDEMYIKIAKEKRDLEKQLAKFIEESERNKIETASVLEKQEEIEALRSQVELIPDLENTINLMEKEIKGKQQLANNLQLQVEDMMSKYNLLINQLEELKIVSSKFETELATERELTSKLKKELENSSLVIDKLEGESEKLHAEIKIKEGVIEALNTTVKEHQLIVQKYKEMEEYQKCVQSNTNTIEEELDTAIKPPTVDRLEHQRNMEVLQKDIAEKELEISNKKKQCEDLNNEIIHLHDLLNEKDKIIKQMSKDSKSLHTSLETIQSKIQESGNIIDLGKRLREEQRKNADLMTEVYTLKAQLLPRGNTDMTTSIDEMAFKVRRELDFSAHLDSNIITAISDCGLDSLNENDLDKLKQSLIREKSLNKELTNSRDAIQKALHEMERKHGIAQQQIEKLQSTLEKERTNLNTVQLEDAKLIEQMRIKLSVVVDHELEFEKLLETEKNMRCEAEKQLAILKQNTNPSSSSNSKTEATEYKSLPSKENLLQKHLATMHEENTNLNKKLKEVKQEKIEAETNLKYTKEILVLKEGEVANLEFKLERMRQSETALKDNTLKLRTQLEKRMQEAENTRILMEELDQDRATLKAQVKGLNEKLSLLTSTADKVVLSDELQCKIDKLNESVKHNNELISIIEQLSSEKKRLEEIIQEMDNRTSGEKPFDDPLARANYLFAKYLRSESFRKSLVWQKSYLISLLATYQELPLPESVTRVTPRSDTTQKRKVSFKCAALAIIAINRIKFLVIRWHSGKRLTNKINANHINKIKAAGKPSPHFHVGQPISEQHFTASATPWSTCDPQPSKPDGINTYHSSSGSSSSSSNYLRENTQLCHSYPLLRESPWSGNTPPSKDTRSLQHKPMPRMKRLGEQSPLTAPELLSSYVERFNQIRQKIGVTLHSNSGH